MIEPVKKMTVDGQELLIINENSYVVGRGVTDGPVGVPHLPSGGALVNLPNSGRFKGLAVLNADINVLPQAKFEKILATFKFTK